MTFYIWLFAVLLYWTPYPWLGLILLMGSSVVVGLTRPVARLHLRSLALVAFAFLSFSYGTLFLKEGQSAGLTGALITLCHFAALVVILDFLDLRVDERALLLVCRTFCITGLAAAATLPLGLPRPFYMEGVNDSFRFEFVFAEPSFLGIFCCLLIYLLLFEVTTRPIERVAYVLVLVALSLLSLSGSAITLLALLLAMKLFSGGSNRWLTFGALMLAVAVGASFIYAAKSGYASFLFDRIENLAEGGGDRSAEIRFVAPLLLVLHTIENHPWLGIGFGMADSYILGNYDLFAYLTKKTMEGDIVYNTNIDNGWAYIIFATGFVGLTLVFALFTRCVVRRQMRAPFYVLMLFVLFFAGAVVHPLFVGALFLRRVVDARVSLVPTPASRTTASAAASA